MTANMDIKNTYLVCFTLSVTMAASSLRVRWRHIRHVCLSSLLWVTYSTTLIPTRCRLQENKE